MTTQDINEYLERMALNVRFYPEAAPPAGEQVIDTVVYRTFSKPVIAIAVGHLAYYPGWLAKNRVT